MLGLASISTLFFRRWVQAGEKKNMRAAAELEEDTGDAGGDSSIKRDGKDGARAKGGHVQSSDDDIPV